MPPKKPPGTGESSRLPKPPKRKEPPSSSSNSQKNAPKGRAMKRVRTQDARTILAQSSEAALNNGELDLQSFLKAREFEIKALEDSMVKSKDILTKRAFQQVPRDMRRRTASHNVKRVPKRLQQRAGREMREDNTPTVDPKKRKPGSSRGRVRAETAKRLGILAAKKREKKTQEDGENGAVVTRAARPKIRKDLLNEPPRPKSKFRKRQVHKTWLPTHMWHAKRAKMTEPKKPLWRFSIPITSTEKSYRPTHRAGGARGAVAWDVSYMSTIGLEGPVESLQKVLVSIGIDEAGMWEKKGEKWRSGKRSWAGWLSRGTGDKRIQIAPSTVIWCSSEPDSTNEADQVPMKRPVRRAFVRVHPAAFLEVWTELLRLSKLQRPSVRLEDLRFEIGSIDVTGPGSTEALLGTLHPYYQSADTQEKHAEVFRSLGGLTNPSSVPPNSILAFSVMDPRLKYPPRPVILPKLNDEDANFALLEMLSTWPADISTPSPNLFDRDARFRATRLPAQKSINRRKAFEKPGAYPTLKSTDPAIPIMLLSSRLTSNSQQGTWTLLAPWKCILPIWYGIVHYPLSSGGNPRFGGVDEMRQIHFEHGMPWFPADYPGTNAGFAWEADERDRRKSEWERRPKGKRIEWGSLDLGSGRKGEIGRGWACDFEQVIGLDPFPDISTATDTTQNTEATPNTEPAKTRVESPLQQLTCKNFTALLSSPAGKAPSSSVIATVRITLIGRGIASPCARIYRLPRASSSSDDASMNSTPPVTTREEWLSLLPQTPGVKPPPNPKAKDAKNIGRIPLNAPVSKRMRLLAESLTQNPPLPYPADKKNDEHPLVPDEEDLIGFVTTGEFNLAEGKGVAIGSVLVAKVTESLRMPGEKRGNEGRLCIVRNAGESIGRLARWEAV